MSGYYVYCAALYCDECGEAIREELTRDGKAPTDPDDDSSYDSGEFPKGPYYDGGESDSPDHCDGCKTFLDNALTSDGYRYVKERLDARGADLSDHMVLREWADAYDFKWHQECAECDEDAVEGRCPVCGKAIPGEWRSGSTS